MTRKFNLTTSIIRDWWNDFNREYFGNELKMPNRFEIIKSKRALGQFAARGSVYFGDITTIRISIYYDRDERGFKETLLHEMIHQWQWTRHLPLDHKTNFKRKAAQINKMGGWDISRTTRIEDGVADGIKEKKRSSAAYIVKFTRNGDTPAFAFTTTNLWKKIASSTHSINVLKTSPYYGGDVEVYYLKKRPDSCAPFLMNRKQLKNYNYSTYKDIITPVISAAERVAF